MCGWGWDSARVNGRDYFERGVISVGLECANERNPELAALGVPFMMDLTKDEETKKVLNFLFAYLVYIRPFVAPPGIPADRLKALQDAFAATLKDPEFLAEADRGGVEIRYASPERVQGGAGDRSSTRPTRSRRAGSRNCARPAGKDCRARATVKRGDAMAMKLLLLAIGSLVTAGHAVAEEAQCARERAFMVETIKAHVRYDPDAWDLKACPMAC